MTKIIHELDCDEEREEEAMEEAVTLLSNGSVLASTTVIPYQAYCFIQPNTVKICRARSAAERGRDQYNPARFCIILTSLLLTLRL